MNLLAIESASQSTSVALQCGTQLLLRESAMPRQQSKLLLTFVDELLAEAGIHKSSLDGIAWSAGPGSFTGLRIGAGLVAGLAFGLDLPVVPVSTLAAMAQRAYAEREITASIVALDARMAEVYWGAYCVDAATGLVVNVTSSDAVTAPAALQLPVIATHAPWVGVGSGFAVYGDELKQHTGITTSFDGCEPHAREILQLALPKFIQQQVVAADAVIPTYCRNDVAHRS